MALFTIKPLVEIPDWKGLIHFGFVLQIFHRFRLGNLKRIGKTERVNVATEKDLFAIRTPTWVTRTRSNICKSLGFTSIFYIEQINLGFFICISFCCKSNRTSVWTPSISVFTTFQSRNFSGRDCSTRRHKPKVVYHLLFIIRRFSH